MTGLTFIARCTYNECIHTLKKAGTGVVTTPSECGVRRWEIRPSLFR